MADKALANKSSKDLAELLTHYGYALKESGPHEEWVRFIDGRENKVFVPANRGSIPKGILLSILEQAEIPKNAARQFWSLPKSNKPLR